MPVRGSSRLRPAGAPPLRAVLLDLGDTLMHVHPDVPSLYVSALADLGVASGGRDAVVAALVAGEELYREATRAGRPFESSMAEATSFWGEYNARVLAGLGVPEGDRVRLAATLSERFWAPASWRLFDEVPAVLAALRAAGLRLAVISNFTETLVGLIRGHALDTHLDAVVVSTTFGSQKPDPALFREALRRLDVPADAAVHVGDNYVADVLGARAAGVAAVLLDRSTAGTPGMYDFAARVGIGAAPRPRLDCPVAGDLVALLELLGVPGGRTLSPTATG